MKTAIELIAAERERQTTAEGYDPDHDDAHELGELALAAAAYALPDHERPLRQDSVLVETARGLSDPPSPQRVAVTVPRFWPWEAECWKPGDRVRELVKAGALIAAEIDRLQRNGHA